MEDLGTVCPFVQILDLPVPQTVENVTDALRILDQPMAKQVIEVPKISCSPCPSRSCIREPQVAEQLVQVPTIVSFSSLQRIAEQNVDIPGPHRAGRIAGLQGFLPGQSSTALQERISERILEQIVDCIPGGGPQGFRPGQSSSSSSHRPAGINEDTDEPGDGFFALIPGEKSAEVAGQVSADLPGTSAHGLLRLMCSPGSSMRRRRRRSVWRCTTKLQRLWNERVSCWSRRARGGRGKRGRRGRRGGFPGLPHIPLAAALVFDNGSGIVLGGFAGFVLCFPSLSSGPGCAASCSVWTRRTVLQRDSGLSVEPLVSGSHVQCLPRPRHTGIGFFWEMTSMTSLYSAQLGSTVDSCSCVRLRRLWCGSGCSRRRHWQWHVLCWFVGEEISRAVFSLVGRPMMLGIMAGVVQKDSFALLWR